MGGLCPLFMTIKEKIEQAKKRIKELEILIKLWEGKKIKLN